MEKEDGDKLGMSEETRSMDHINYHLLLHCYQGQGQVKDRAAHHEVSVVAHDQPPQQQRLPKSRMSTLSRSQVQVTLQGRGRYGLCHAHPALDDLLQHPPMEEPEPNIYMNLFRRCGSQSRS